MKMETDGRVFDSDNGRWDQLVDDIDSNGEETTVCIPVSIVDVTVPYLLREWEDLVFELSEKEMELLKLKEEHNRKEFEILTSFDFKKVYGKDNEKIRKAHVHNELFDLDKGISDLELSINWIKGYIPLLKEVVRCKQ